MSIVTPKLKAIYKTSVFSLSDLAFVKNQSNLTDWGVFICTKLALKNHMQLDTAALLFGFGQEFDTIGVLKEFNKL